MKYIVTRYLPRYYEVEADYPQQAALKLDGQLSFASMGFVSPDSPTADQYEVQAIDEAEDYKIRRARKFDSEFQDYV